MIRILAVLAALICAVPAVAQPLPANLDKANAIVIDTTKGRIVIKLRPDIAPEHAERIFEPFYSGGRGTGLGLFLARELAQTNGATLLYEPRAGGGSVFRLVFADPRRWEI